MFFASKIENIRLFAAKNRHETGIHRSCSCQCDIKSSADNPLCSHSGRMRIFFQILKWKFKFMLCYLHAETADDKDHRLLPLCLEPPSGILQQVLYKKEREPYGLQPQQFYSSYPQACFPLAFRCSCPDASVCVG